MVTEWHDLSCIGKWVGSSCKPHENIRPDVPFPFPFSVKVPWVSLIPHWFPWFHGFLSFPDSTGSMGFHGFLSFPDSTGFHGFFGFPGSMGFHGFLSFLIPLVSMVSLVSLVPWVSMVS